MTNHKVELVGTIMLQLCMGEALIRVALKIDKVLEVSVVFEKLFIDNVLKGIFSAKRKIVPFKSLPIPILMVHEA